VRGRKLELEHFLNHYGVDICLLSETFLNPRQAFWTANYVCHRTYRPPWYSHHSVPVPGLTHLEDTAIQVILACKPVKILSFYLTPTRPLIRADLIACIGGGFPVLMAGDLSAKNLNCPRDGGNSYVIMPTRTPVCSLDWTPQPPTVITPWLLPMSWAS
jgi:hypothetical protein